MICDSPAPPPECSGKKLWQSLLSGNWKCVMELLTGCHDDVADALLYEDSVDGSQTVTNLGLFIAKCENEDWNCLLIETVLEQASSVLLHRIITECDSKGRNSIHWAVKYNNINLLECLLDRLPTNLRVKAVQQPDTWGRSNIQWAFRLNNVTAMSVLVNALA